MKNKRLISVLTALLLIATLCMGCGKEPSPSDAVKEQLEAFRTNAAETMRDDADLGLGELVDMEDAKEFVEKIMDYEYEIVSEKVDGDEADVEVKITTYPFGEALEEVIPTVFMLALSGGDEEDMTNALLGAFTKLDEKSYSKTFTVHCTKKDDAWETDLNEENVEFINAVFGGMMDAVENISNMFDMDE